MVGFLQETVYIRKLFLLTSSIIIPLMVIIIPSMSNSRLAKFISKGIKFSFFTAFFFFQGCMRLFKGRREAVKKGT